MIKFTGLLLAFEQRHCETEFLQTSGLLFDLLALWFFSGFGERLLTEVKKLAPKDVKIKVGPPPALWIALGLLKHQAASKWVMH